MFDDITRLLQAQRIAAWGEVARRLAHEIKNPLTPIQLSAERLTRRLANKLSPDDAEMLMRATETIVAQVGQLKGMVDAFSQYARIPEIRLEPLDLNRLVREVLALYESHGRGIILELDEALPRVEGDQARLRQVIHNLLQNAEQAVAEVKRPRIVIYTQRDLGNARLTVQDNGTGFPPDILARAFEPYVTTKPQGNRAGAGHREEDRRGAQRKHRDPQPEARRSRGCYFAARSEGEAGVRSRSQRTSMPDENMSQILVVDDEVGIRELLSEILREEGHQVRLAENAGEARSDS